MFFPHKKPLVALAEFVLREYDIQYLSIFKLGAGQWDGSARSRFLRVSGPPPLPHRCSLVRGNIEGEEDILKYDIRTVTV